MPATALAAAGVAVIAVVLLVAWHLLGNWRSPPGQGE